VYYYEISHILEEVSNSPTANLWPLCFWHLLSGAILEYTDGDRRRHGQRFRHVQEDDLPATDSHRPQLELTLRVHHLNSPVVWVSQWRIFSQTLSQSLILRWSAVAAAISVIIVAAWNTRI